MNLTYTYKGKKYALNAFLVLQQCLDQGHVDNIKKLHKKKHEVFEQMEFTNDPAQLKTLAKEVQELEYQLQFEWGFSRDHTRHRWFDVPKCTCPKLDNSERLGLDHRIIAGNCPIHSTS